MGTTSDSTDSDIYVAKTNKLGEAIWSQTIDNGENEIGNDITITADNKILIAGSTTREDLQNNISSGTQSILMLILEMDGSEVDRLQNGFQQTGDCYATKVVQVPNGNLLVLGSALNSQTGYTEIMVMAYQYANQKITSTPLAYNTYGREGKHTEGTTIKHISESQVIIGGVVSNSGSTNHTAYLNILEGAALSSVELTNEIWDKTLFDGTVLSGVNAVYYGSNDSIYVAGFTENPSISQGQQDQILVKISKDGVLDEQWGQNLGGTGNDVYNDFSSSTDGGFICIGTTEFEGNTMISLTKTDSHGKLINN